LISTIRFVCEVLTKIEYVLQKPEKVHSNAQMSEKQTIVTFDSDAKPPNYGPMKLHTKPLKRRENGKDVSKWKKYTVDDEDDGSMPIPPIDCEAPTEHKDMFSGVDAKDTGLVEKDTGLVKKDTGLVKKDTGLVEKDIRLVMSEACVTRELAITTLQKHDGDIVNAIMELVEYS
jgi:NACalpha-BTF3-like transcription factor